MKARKVSLIPLLLVLLVLPFTGRANAPQGKFLLNLSGMQVYDLSGSYDGQAISASFDDLGQYLWGISLNVDGRGRITGDATLSTFEGSDLDTVCVGSIRRSSPAPGAVTRVRLTFKTVRYTVNDGTRVRAGKRHVIALNMTVVGPDPGTPPSQGSFFLTGTGRISISGLGSRAIAGLPAPPDPILSGLPQFWRGNVSITAGVKRHNAVPLYSQARLRVLSADLTVTNRELPYIGKGKYRLPNGISTLKYKGTDYPSFFTRFSWRVPPRLVSTDPVTFTNLDGRILGQRVRLSDLPFDPPAYPVW